MRASRGNKTWFRRRAGIAGLLGLGAAALSFVLLGQTANAQARDALVPLVRSLPWPGVSGLIGYDGRLWFANSVKFVNHNSADIYSYDPATGETRYERHLFSQDAGDPVVAYGLLYWPFEDSRFSPGRGEFMVTDGSNWRWGLLPEGRAFHVHTMTLHRGALYAAPSAWRAHIQRSLDHGTTWQPVFTYPSPPRQVTRITALKSLNGTLYGGLTIWSDESGPKLLRWADEKFHPVRGWPAGSAVPRLEAFRGWLYGDNVSESGAAVWRTDGTRVERVTGLDGHVVRALAAGADALWAVSVGNGGGALWRSADGVAWTRHQDFAGARPFDVAVYAGRVYVGARGSGGGMLWGPPAPAPMAAPAPAAQLPRGRAHPTEPLSRSLAALDRVLADPDRLRRIRSAVVPLALRGDAATGKALLDRLDGPFANGDAAMFGGRVKIPAAKMARWYLLWAIAHNGHGRVPPGLIAAPWTARPNRAEKYLEPAPAAAWTAAELGQNDAETIDALIARLERPGDPKWLRGDMIGALTALTGRRFGYDLNRWRRWHAARRKDP